MPRRLNNHVTANFQFDGNGKLLFVFFASLLICSSHCFITPICLAQRPLNTQKLEIPFTPPAKALEMISLPDGFIATLFASEPDVHQPIAVATDHRGRLWVVECYTYSDGTTNYDLSLRDRVSIFEDTDRDGRFDIKTVFWDQGQKLTGIELGYGGVWLTAAPNFIFIPDRDGDDKPDGPPEILLNGFNGDVIRHNIVNGLRWGPDGWLYGRHGIQATSHVGSPNATSSQRTPMNCAIWRFHPVHKKFEVVAEGGTNPWGFDYDEHGEMFMINTVIGHLFHVVPAARYRRMYGSHFNPHTYQVIEQTADHFHWDLGEEHWMAGKNEGLSSGTDAAGGGHAHTGLMIYQGANWPAKYHNTLFTANFHGRRLNNDTIHREGNGYTGRHAADFMKSGDPWFRGIEMIYGPDGGVFVLDWSDIGECHEDDGIHRTSGRIFKIIYEEPVIPAPGLKNGISQEDDDQSENDNKLDKFPSDLSRLSDEALVGWVLHENAWYFRKARRLLAERKAKNSLGSLSEWEMELKKLSANRKFDIADEWLPLRAIWTLHALGIADEKFLIECSHSPLEHVRAWAVRLLADGLRKPGQTVIQRFTELAQTETSGLVRLYVASSLNRFDGLTRIQIANQLCQYESDAKDRTQPHLIWFGIEPVVTVNWQAALKLAESSKIPLIRENIIRRLTSEITTMPESVDAILDGLQNKSLESVSTFRGMNLALEGWAHAPRPKNWMGVAKQFSNSSENSVQEAILNLGVVFGDGRAVEELRKIAVSVSADVAIRRRAIASWSATKPDDLENTLRKLIQDKSLTCQVVKSMVYCESPDTANIIINRWPHMTPEGKLAAINTLVSRDAWAIALLSAVKNGRIPKDVVTAYHAGRMNEFDNEILRAELKTVWGTVRSTSAEKAQTIFALTKQLLPDSKTLVSHNASAGRALFIKNCAACHTLFGEGGNTGPDLTGANRQNINYLLTNIVDPSSSVAEAYHSSVIALNDGRLVSGLMLGENQHVVRVQTPEKVINIPRNDIGEIRDSENSVMPDGLLNNLNPQQTADLIGYLMSPSQVPLPADD